jgi:hypothetical protein
MTFLTELNANGPRTRLLILCPLAKEWSLLVRTFEASFDVERLHDLKIEAGYIPDWRVLVATGGHERHNSLFRPNT